MPAALTLATRRRRFASTAYEALLMAGLLFISGFLLVPILQWLPETVRRTVLQLCLLAVAGVYCVLCWTKGGTLAMKTWGIRIARADGESVSARRAVARFLLAIPSVGALGVGLLWSVVDREKQFLHDRWAGTRLFDSTQSAALKPADGSNARNKE